MKTLIITIAFCSLMAITVNAQQQHTPVSTSQDTTYRNKSARHHYNGYQRTDKKKTVNDSTSSNAGFSQLSGSPGPATTSGAGGLGTNERPGYNTSRDVYNIDRRDSIKHAKQHMHDNSRGRDKK